ncbi:MAG: fatty acid desaturase [Parvibaculum sp.]|uniref:fatty acid desaturase n=1 Tax=Parvibaculum sp. TaxID=2024848 RepID=UPI0034A05A96
MSILATEGTRNGIRPSKAGVPSDWLTPEERAVVTEKSLGRGLRILGAHYTLYFVTLVGAVAPLPIAANILFAVANGALIGLLFLIGHDSGHSAFVPGRTMNRWITRFVFVPCLHSRSLWDVVHNRIHHRYTNLKGFDYVWAPMGKDEFDAASPLRRGLERVYRSVFGPLIYYWVAFWIPKLVLPISPESRGEWRRHLPDTLFVIFVGGGMVAAIGILGGWLAPERTLLSTMLLGWFIPFAVWNYLMALSIFLQHNHPKVPWFDNPDEWSFYGGNIRGTAHVDLPFDFLPLFKWVMLHHAHHALPSIPGYKLTEAQAMLIEAYGNDVVRYRLSLGEYLNICSSCKLFDYERKQWTDFDGKPTAAPIDLAAPGYETPKDLRAAWSLQPAAGPRSAPRRTARSRRPVDEARTETPPRRAGSEPPTE